MYVAVKSVFATIIYGRLKKVTFCNCDYDCTTKYRRKISRNYNIPKIVITKRNTQKLRMHNYAKRNFRSEAWPLTDYDRT